MNLVLLFNVMSLDFNFLTYPPIFCNSWTSVWRISEIWPSPKNIWMSSL